MPRYDYECPRCGTIEDVITGMNEIFISCPKCNKEAAKRLFSPPVSKPVCDIEPYWDENITGTPVYITSRAHKAEVLKQHGLKMRKGISDYR